MNQLMACGPPRLHSNPPPLLHVSKPPEPACFRVHSQDSTQLCRRRQPAQALIPSSPGLPPQPLHLSSTASSGQELPGTQGPDSAGTDSGRELYRVLSPPELPTCCQALCSAGHRADGIAGPSRCFASPLSYSRPMTKASGPGKRNRTWLQTRSSLPTRQPRTHPFLQ